MLHRRSAAALMLHLMPALGCCCCLLLLLPAAALLGPTCNVVVEIRRDHLPVGTARNRSLRSSTKYVDLPYTLISLYYRIRPGIPLLSFINS